MTTSSGSSSMLHRLENDGLCKCIWMMSGLVNYKLCDRDYDCEHCPFDRAIKGTGRVHGHESSAAQGDWKFIVKNQGKIRVSVQGYEVDRTLFYHPYHTWVRVEEGGTVRVGLDDFGQKLLGRIYSLRLPELDSRLICGETGWQISHGAGETDLMSPFSGKGKRTESQGNAVSLADQQ